MSDPGCFKKGSLKFVYYEKSVNLHSCSLDTSKKKAVKFAGYILTSVHVLGYVSRVNSDPDKIHGLKN
jgi:hypothetical protein